MNTANQPKGDSCERKSVFSVFLQFLSLTASTKQRYNGVGESNSVEVVNKRILLPAPTFAVAASTYLATYVHYSMKKKLVKLSESIRVRGERKSFKQKYNKCLFSSLSSIGWR